MNKAKKYRVVVWNYGGPNSEGVPSFYGKYVSEWPKDASKFGARYELSPHKEDALTFGRDTALDVAHTIRMRSPVWSAMVEEA